MYRREYPIRCKSCNEQLACYSEKYENFSRKYGYEKALNLLGIMEPCSRYNMMNPTMILNIKENRNLIEGLEDIDVIDKFSETLSFKQCEYNIGNIDYNKMKKEVKIKKDIELEKNLLPTNIIGKQSIQKQIYLSPVGVNKPIIKQNISIANINPLTLKQKSQSIKQLNKPLLSPSQQVNRIKELTIEENESELEKIKISEPEKEVEFKYPTIVGIPTINKSEENTRIHISGKYYAEVLSGRTYIAR